MGNLYFHIVDSIQEMGNMYIFSDFQERIWATETFWNLEPRPAKKTDGRRETRTHYLLQFMGDGSGGGAHRARPMCLLTTSVSVFCCTADDDGSTRCTAERGVRVVPHPGRHGPDGRPYEDDVGQRDGAAALPQPRHLLQPARHGHAVPPLLRRPHRRLRRGTYHTCGLALSLE